MKKICLVMALLAASHAPAAAWGWSGHRMIGEQAAKNFPKDIPAFLRTPEAGAQIGLLSQEPDRSRNAGQPHDADSDPGHYVNLSDDGSIRGGPTLATLPATRRDYDTALRAAGSNEYVAGFLPFNIMDGYQQLVKDFALWRMDVAAQKYAKKFSMTAAERRYFARRQRVRELLTLRDLGVWAHYVGDASQPMHLSVHFNGWGEGANPKGFVVAPGAHAKFESAFVNAAIVDADVASRLRPYHACACDIRQRMQDYLSASWALVEPAYELDKAGAFDTATPQSKAFTADRLAEAASQLRDLVSDAWADSGKAMLGYPNQASVADLESGQADPRPLY
ncbi:MAG: S1/P1 Nuclease [Rhizomicrobium sp.]